MQAPLYLSCTPAPDGGVTLAIGFSGGDEIVSFPLDHLGALNTAGSILMNAGVARVEYENGRLQEMAQS